MENQYNRKIRNRLLFLILGASTLVLMVLGFATYYFSFDLMSNVVEEMNRDEVELAVTKIDRWIEQKKNIVDIVADVEGRNINTPHELVSYLRDVQFKFSAKAIFVAYQKNGAFVSSDSWEPPTDWDPREREWYKQAIALEEAIVTTPYEDATYPHERVLTIAKAIRNKDGMQGVVGVDVSMDSIRLIMDNMDLGKYSRAYLLSDSGDVIEAPVRTRGKSVEKPKQANIKDFIDSGESLKTYFDWEYRVFAKVQGAPLIVVLHFPLAEVHSQLEKLSYIFSLGALGSLLVLALVVLGVSTLIARPVLSLAEGAKQIADGNFRHRLTITTKDELGFVSHRFNLMAEELLEKDLIRSTFGRYVSPEAVNEILSGKMALGGEKRLVSVMMCDLRGFTAFSEKADPEKLVSLLNDYFTRMDSIIRANGGSINRYLGDGILALFGAPVMLENSGLASIKAALAMRDELKEFNASSGTNFELGIGIHTGVAIVGNIGSKTHTEYTVIGDVANLACRIESLTKLYGETILVSEAVSALLPQGMYRMKIVDKVRVFGKAEPVMLLSPHLKEGANDAMLDKTRIIVETYLQGNFGHAAELILCLDDSHKTAHLDILLRRCQNFMLQAPKSWDGVFTFSSKE